MPLFIISILIQVAFVIHVIRTGRDTMWIWIVVMLPVAGSLAYLFLEVLPELMGSRRARDARRKARKILAPDADVRAAQDNYARTRSIENSFRLADELMEEGQHHEAIGLYRQSLQGEHRYDPHILQGLASALFRVGEYAEVISTLDELAEHNPDHRNAQAHLLYARARQYCGDTAAALQEYAALLEYYPGPDAGLYYARLLREQGRGDEARSVLEGLHERARLSGRHYQSVHKDILREVDRELAR